MLLRYSALACLTAAILLPCAETQADSLQSVLDSAVRAQGIPGAAAAVVTAQDQWAGGSGQAHLEPAQAMTASSVLYIGSLSKVMTATLVLNLIESDQLQLDATLVRLSGGTQRAAATITVEHLLTHTSGLPQEAGRDYWFNAEFPDASELITALRQSDLRFAPGQRSGYSNMGYALLGLLVENPAALSYADALEQNVLTPLGMDATSSLAAGHELAGGYSPAGRVVPGAERPFAGLGHRIGDRHSRIYHNARAMAPAFGISSSAEDMRKFASFLLFGRPAVLGDQWREQLFRPRVFGRSLGLRISNESGRRLARHGGWFAAHRSHLVIDPVRKIAVVVMANSDDADPERIANALLAVAEAQPESR